MKNNKISREDDIVVETIKQESEELLKIIITLFNKCLKETKTSAAWDNALITIMHKKRNIANLKNYRSISLSHLSHTFKLFIKILTKCFIPKFDFYQLIEQAGFRTAPTSILQLIKILIEKSIEYKKLFVLILVDYKKAFDSIK